MPLLEANTKSNKKNMITKSTLDFFAELQVNNNKDWFEANRPRYVAAKENIVQLTHQVLQGVNKLDAGIAALNYEPKNCISRINRDIRFSANKAPYKNNLFVQIKQGGKKSELGAYYINIEPNASFVGAGNYMPMAPDLFKIRQEIDYNYAAFSKIIQAKKFKEAYKTGIETSGTLTRPPKGFDAESDAIELIKMKGFVVVHRLTNKEMQDDKLVQHVLDKFKVAKPFLDFINEPLRSE